MDPRPFVGNIWDNFIMTLASLGKWMYNPAPGSSPHERFWFVLIKIIVGAFPAILLLKKTLASLYGVVRITRATLDWILIF
jgi:hypothetical protein